MSPAYWLGNQAIVQRTLGAKSEWDAKASMLFVAFLKTFVPLAFVLPVLLGLQLLGTIDPDKTDGVYPLLIEELQPVGLRGILYAAFLAALMSSIDSYANSAATILLRSRLGPLDPPPDAHALAITTIRSKEKRRIGRMFPPGRCLLIPDHHNGQPATPDVKPNRWYDGRDGRCRATWHE